MCISQITSPTPCTQLGQLFQFQKGIKIKNRQNQFGQDIHLRPCTPILVIFLLLKGVKINLCRGPPQFGQCPKEWVFFSGSPSLVWPTLHLLPKSEDPIYSLSRLPKKIKFVRNTRISQGGSLMNLVRGLSDHCRIIKVKQLFLWGRGGGGSVHPNFLNPFEYRKLLPDKSFPKRIGTTPNP